mmetsp:Transcript_1966/g.8871  ORF Transcript_1966/g.8871 Transcript_1966/m.8871 type:complete len:202 (+) Transcript_1966:407-1012(+)
MAVVFPRFTRPRVHCRRRRPERADSRPGRHRRRGDQLRGHARHVRTERGPAERQGQGCDASRRRAVAEDRGSAEGDRRDRNRATELPNRSRRRGHRSAVRRVGRRVALHGRSVHANRAFDDELRLFTSGDPAESERILNGGVPQGHGPRRQGGADRSFGPREHVQGVAGGVREHHRIRGRPGRSGAGRGRDEGGGVGIRRR